MDCPFALDLPWIWLSHNTTYIIIEYLQVHEILPCPWTIKSRRAVPRVRLVRARTVAHSI
eukprot:SAG31_NODE_33959_length_338_cov_0.861925_1_plen_59_part_10